MKRLSVLLVALMLVTLMVGIVSAAQKVACNSIQSNTITDVKGNPLVVGYDKWGYNYQAHMFNGLSNNYTRPNPPALEGLEHLIMKWSDEWISNLDCNRDGKLDRGLDQKTGISDGISKGWLTNHYEGDYEADGELRHYTYFCKIIWVGPAPVGSPDPWATTRLWGQYAIIEEVLNDPYGKFHGIIKETMAKPTGFGFYIN